MSTAATQTSRVTARWRRPILIGRAIVAFVVIAVTVELLRVHGGVAGTELAASWQLLDLRILEHDLLNGLWYLHTQPPLHNLVVGLVAWSPLPVAGTLFALFTGCLLVIGLVLQGLLVRWGVPVTVATVAACMAVANPALLSTIRIVSYEVPLAATLMTLVWVLDRYLRSPAPRLLAAVAGLALALVLTRSLFHPLWLATVLAIVMVARPVSRREVVACIAVPLVVIGGWVLKNVVLVESASLSSWTGFNLHRGVLGPLDADSVEEAVSTGVVSSLALERPWLPLDAYTPWLDGCLPAHGHPALSEESKAVGAMTIPNFNHECYLPLYRQSRNDALTMIRREPAQFTADRMIALGLSFSYTPLGHDSTSFSLLGEPLPRTSWMDRLFAALVLRQRIDVDTRSWNVPLYGDAFRIELAWPLVAATLIVLGRSVVAVRPAWRAHRAGVPPDVLDVVYLVAGSTIVFVVLGGDLVELGENSRFRAMLDPLLIGLTAAQLWFFVDRRRRRSVRADA